MSESIMQLSQKVDALMVAVEELAETQQRQSELFAEMGPILKEVMAVSTTRLEDLEQRGYFEFGREMANLVDTVVTSYSGDDVRQLGDNIVSILNTVRRVTQPDVLALASDAVQAIDHAEDLEPKGVFGMLKESRDHDVQRGMAVMLEVLRYVGRGAHKLHHDDGSDGAASPLRDRKKALAGMLAPRRAALPAPTPAPLAARTAPPPVPSASAAPPPATGVDGARCQLIDDDAWDRGWAATTAVSIGIDLTEAHWNLLQAARADYQENGTSPNIRRLTRVSGVSTRDIYTLFPTKPGIAVALCAGIPKPGGCI